MPALENVKHERFAAEVIRSPSYGKAYGEVYDVANDAVARSNASRLLSNADVKNRVFELLREQKADLPAIAGRFGKFLQDDENPAQSWDAVKTGFKLYGLLDGEEKHSANMQNIQINIEIL